MSLVIYNTLSREKEPFAPLDAANVRLYVCGPTVYGYIHVGNARPPVVFDVLARHLDGAVRGAVIDDQHDAGATLIGEVAQGLLDVIPELGAPVGGAHAHLHSSDHIHARQQQFGQLDRLFLDMLTPGHHLPRQCDSRMLQDDQRERLHQQHWHGVSLRCQG